MGDYSMLLILTFAAATLSLLAFLAVLQLPKAMRNVVQEVHAERMAERRQAVTIECIYRDYRAYKNITSLIAAPMEVGTAKEQTLASIRELVSGVERLRQRQLEPRQDFHVRQQEVTEVARAEHNNVVKAFPANRTDQPFSIPILPRGARRRRSIANAHRSKPSDEDLTIGPVPVTNETAGSLFPAAGFRDLICDPICGRMRCDAKP